MLLRAFIGKKRISRKALTDIKFHGGKLYVNGIEKNVRTILQTGDQVTVVFPPEKRGIEMHPKPIPISLMYKDASILAIDKPSGLLTIPSAFHTGDSLAQGVLFYFDQIGLESTFHAINRLDKNTSGIMLVAKHRYIHHLFSCLQKIHAIQRIYIAIVHGEISEKQGVIDAPIGRVAESLITRQVCPNGQRALTEYQVLFCQNGYSVVKVFPKTGRTHQIRVHMASIGHPLVGDDLYGGSVEKMNRHALHSTHIQFYHPILEQVINISCAEPTDFQAFIAAYM